MSYDPNKAAETWRAKQTAEQTEDLPMFAPQGDEQNDDSPTHERHNLPRIELPREQV